MEISGSTAMSSVLSQIAAHNSISSVQQAAPPVRSAPVQTVMRAATAVQEPDANEALTYTLEQLRTARQTAMQTGAIKGSIINVYA